MNPRATSFSAYSLVAFSPRCHSRGIFLPSGKTMNHCQIVLRELKRAGRAGITQADLIPHAVWRLAARIYDLRSAGYEIDTLTEEAVNKYGNTIKYGRYRLV
jgi:hypothetical protein